LKGHLDLGAQETTADGVPYLGSASENLVLHFWPLVMGLGVAVALLIDQGRPKEESTGFVITVPDVHDLEGFCEDFAASTAQLDGQAHPFFKDRPRAALLAIPQEGGLDYLARLTAVARARAAGRAYATSLSGTEVYYMKTGGQQPRLATVARMAVTRDVLERYESVSTSRQTPTFRRQLITNVLDSAPWYRSFNRIFDDLPDALFVGSGQWFSADADRMFKQQQVRAEEAQ
jgi:CRISPR-associated protein Cmx8